MGELAGSGRGIGASSSDLKGVALGAAVGGEIAAHTAKARPADQTADSPVPVTAGAENEAAQQQPEQQTTPTAPASTSPAREQSAPTPTPERPSTSDDDRVWVPATGRYADGASDYNDLAHSVGQADARISADADAIDRELHRYQPDSARNESRA